MSGTYSVIICSRCRRPKIADTLNKTTTCPHCGKVLQIRKMNLHGSADSPDDLIPILTSLNRNRTTIRQFIPRDPVTSAGEIEITVPDVSHTPAAPGTRSDRLSMIRAGLKDRKDFTIDEFIIAFTASGGKKEKAADLLAALMERGDVYCPRRGLFRFVDG